MGLFYVTLIHIPLSALLLDFRTEVEPYADDRYVDIKLDLIDGLEFQGPTAATCSESYKRIDMFSFKCIRAGAT